MDTENVQAPKAVETSPESEHAHNNFFSGKAFKIAALIILIVGVFGTVIFAEIRQITSSHASGTVTLSVDKNPQIDLAGRKVTFFVRLTSSGDDTPLTFGYNNHPAVAAVKVRVDTSFSGQSPEVTRPLNIFSFTPHMPLAFPLASNNPSGIPPFSNSVSPTPTLHPLPSCPPATGGKGFEKGIPCVIKVQTQEEHQVVDRINKNVLYFSVGDKYTKTVNTSVVLGDLAITVPLPFGYDPKKPLSASTIAWYRNAVLKISFGSDTKVYKLSGDPKSPFVAIPFIAQDATFNLQSLLSGITPTPTGVKSSVAIETILDCLDLHKPITDKTSNYFSANCMKHADRAKADLNGDGWINQVDLNLYYRHSFGN